MKVSNTRKTPSRSAIARHAGALPIAALLVTGALTGCGGDGGSALDEFVGIWEIDFTKDFVFQLACPAPNVAESRELAFWTQFRMEAGVLTDLIETSGLCPFQFNVAGKIASVPNPDPFTKESPVCRLDAGQVPGTIFADIRPSWDFRLLAPKKGEAPTAQLVATDPLSTLTFVRIVGAAEMPDPPCTYTAQASLFKIAQF